jgi:hypothetical protein
MAGPETQKPVPKQGSESEALTSQNAVASAEERTESAKKSGRRAAEASLDEMETREIDQPIDKEELKKLTEGYPEVNPDKYRDIVAGSLKNIKEQAGPAGSLHKGRYQMIAEDGHKYIYIRDNTHTPPDRLFRKSEPEKIVIVGELDYDKFASPNFEGSYTEVEGEIAERIIATAKKMRRFKGNPPTATLYVEDLIREKKVTEQEFVDNEILRQVELNKDRIGSRIAFMVNLGGAVKVFVGKEKQ